MARTSLKCRIAGLLATPLPALAMLAAGTAAGAQPALPTGGTVVAGSATIGAPTGSSLTVTQGSARAIVDWSGFSVGQGGSVRFDNGAGATLNRVTGGNISTIDGALSASGSVYLINPNGVVIGKGGVVDVGGSFVATTLGIGNDAFMAGGDLGFAGTSDAAVINLGKIGALGGDVALIASRVENRGTITAADGTAGLLAGTDVLLRDAALDGGRFVVRVGGSGTSATNAGTIAAAAAELRANGGNVYALAGDTGGAISANGVAERDGRVWLTAGDTGTVQVAGTLTTRGANGAPGFVETSGGTVQVGAATIDAGPGGTWLLDPTDIMIDQTAANTIAGTLNAGTNVTQQTSAAGVGGSGDITVQDNVALTWNTAAALTLSAYRNIVLGYATIRSTGGGPITLYSDSSGTGDGRIVGGIYSSSPTIATSGPVTAYYHGTEMDRQRQLYINFTGGGPLTIYKLIDNQNDLAGINDNLAGAYALNRDLDGVSGVIGAPVVDGSAARTFTGIFDGQGHSISNFTGSAMSQFFDPYAGLFARLAAPAIVRDLNLIGGAVTATLVPSYYGSGGVGGSSRGAVGALAGSNDGGLIQNVSSSVAVTGSGVVYVGGLVGVNSSGTITNSYANGSVVGTAATLVYTGLGQPGPYYPGQATTIVINTANTGGLVGGNGGTITSSYATSTVSGVASTNTAGFAGLNSGVIDGAYASGATTGLFGGLTAGFVAANASNANSPAATVTNAYWDAGSTGQLLGYGTNTGTITRLVGIGGDTGFSPYAASTYTRFNFGSDGAWVILDGQTRPLLQSEYAARIETAHQLQLAATKPGASYTLANDIDLRGTANGADIWSTAGFAPIGTSVSPFTGTLDGAGYIVSNLAINRTAAPAFTGLFGSIAAGGVVRNLTLIGGSVQGTGQVSSMQGAVGALAGRNAGTIVNVFSTVNVTASGTEIGGLVGTSFGTISGSRTDAATQGVSNVGGLAGSNYGTVSTSSASGSVIAAGTQTGGTPLIVGGLVGSNSGAVSDSYATASVNGGSNSTAGGLVGLIGGGFPPLAPAGSVMRSYASGQVQGGTVGGLVGASFGTVANSYWDAGIFSGRAIGQSGSSATNVMSVGGSGPSAYATASYAALDLSAAGPWVLLQGATRPILRAEYNTRITNGHQLQLVATNLGATYTLGHDVDLAATANPSEVWNAAAGFAPIGSASTPFYGSLTGTGHRITGLRINLPGSDNVGLFAALTNPASGGLFGVTLTGAVTGRGNVGLLVGANNGVIGSVTVSGTVTGGDSVGGIVGYNPGIVVGNATGVTVIAANFAGGIAGYNPGTVNGSASGNVTASGSYAGGIAGYVDRTGGIDAAFDGSVTAHDYAGGVAGFNGGGIGGSSAGANGITNVTAIRGAGGLVGFNTGSLSTSSSNAFVSASDLAGGAVGVNFGAIENQKSSSTVTGGTQLGGFAGANASGGTLTNVSASGNVTGTGTLGGLVGYNDGAIATSSATGSVGGTGANFTGGLVGYNALSIAGSLATGNVTGGTFVGGLVGYSDRLGTIANSAAYSTVNGADYAGGLAGFNSGTVANSQTNSAVSASDRGAGGLVAYNTGTITRAFANGSVTAPALSGGLVGLNFGTITLSYANAAASGTDSVGGLVGANAGTLAKVYATGAVSGATQVGGLAGYSRGSVTDVYATGAVSGSDAATTGGLVGFADAQSAIARAYASGAVVRGGGVAGNNSGTLSAIFYDAGTTGAAQAVSSGSATGTASVGGATGRSAYAQASYPGLNFLDVWTIQQGQSRPTLQDNPQNPAPR